MALDIDWRAGAMRELERSAETRALVATAARQVRDRARVNAQSISSRLADAIEADEPAEDALGVYVDVGYDKRREGWVLWFHEVGTINNPARPHLRPALRQG